MKKSVKSELQVVERFETSANFGLNSEQVESRKSQNLTNYVNNKYSKNYLNIFVNNVCTFFNLLGLICCIALICVQAELSNFFFVMIYLANMSIGIVQEIRAKKCIDKLSIVALKDVTVIRNGEKIEIPIKEIVLDDVVVLGLGAQVPTDCLVLSGNVEVNEALLTGESVPVKKKAGEYMLGGSFITSGTCIVRAIKVGKDNYVEKLTAKAKSYKKPQSELMSSLKLIIKIVGFAIVPIATIYFIKSYVFLDANLHDSVLGTSTLTIGMIPSGMFLLTSVALAVGIIKLAKHKTLVQDLYSLEMLARVDTICFDKTGTITDGNMTVTEIVELNVLDTPVNTIIGSMLYALKDNNQTANAMVKYFGENNQLNAITTLPFNSVRKQSAVTFENGFTFAFGAPEFVLDKNTYLCLADKINEYAKLGYRVLVLAKSNMPIIGEILPNNFEPIALINIVDNIREDAISTVKWFKDNDVAVKVISGDNPITVAEVSKRVGIEGADRYVSLEGLTDKQVYDVANDYTVFGRVTPEQKAILIKALKDAGHVTAMTGDGVNDILALKEADCAISVASGSEAAKNISHLVLLDNNFNSMPQIVYEGRRVINNIQSSASLYLMKTIFTMLVAIITFFLPYMKTYPFALNQMILLETMVIGFPSFFLSLQPNDSRLEGNFITYVITRSLPSALIMVLSVTIVETFKVTLHVYNNDVYSTFQVLALTFAGLVSLFMICTPLNKYRVILFLSSLLVLLIVTVVTLFWGVDVIGLEKLSPIADYWEHLLMLVGVILLDIALIIPIKKLCLKMKLPTKKK